MGTSLYEELTEKQLGGETTLLSQKLEFMSKKINE